MSVHILRTKEDNLEEMGMMTFNERERVCQWVFDENGPFWHLYTDGTKIGDIFITEEDFKLGMTLLAVCAILYPTAELVTFELMKNHLHLIMRGSREDCLEFFRRLKIRLRRIFMKTGHVVDWDRFHHDILPIKTLKDLRNEIIYVNRNAYVANSCYTPYNYPWGAGWVYFSPVVDLVSTKSVPEVGICRVRELTHYRDVYDLMSLKFIGDVPFVSSFCRIDLGERMFQDPRSYFNLLTRNAESFSQIASRLKDSVFLTDDELFVIAVKCAAEDYSTKLSLLTHEQKIQLARKLHYQYKASNQLLRRVLKLDIALLNEMFPSPSP